MSSDIVKNIVIYRNGDPKFAGKRFLVNKKQTRTYDAFLNQVTIGLSPTFGAVRRLMTPEHGHKIENLDELQAGNDYVASGLENFKKLKYREIRPALPISSRKNHSPALPEIAPVKHSRVVASGRIKRYLGAASEPKIILVHSNGDELEAPHRIKLTPKELQNWEQVLSAIGERVRLASGAIKWLYTMDGAMVVNLHEISSGEHYVAVGTGGFRALNYMSVKPPLDASPRTSRRSYHLPPLKRTSAEDASNSPNSTQSTQSRRAKATKTSKTSPQETPQRSPQKRPPPSRKAEDPYHAKRNEGKPPAAARNKPSSKKEDDAGFYAKKRGPTAKEVEDSEETRTEQTIDQKRAETIDDEEIAESPRQPKDNSPGQSPLPDSDDEDEEKIKEERRQAELKIKQQREEEARKREEDELRKKEEERLLEVEERKREEEEKKKLNSQESRRDSTSRTDSADRNESTPAPVEKQTSRSKSSAADSRTASRTQSRQDQDDGSKKAAASKIAAGYRGYQVRKQVKQEKKLNERKQAAAKIQAGYRGHQTRKEIKDRTEKQQAAAKIQAGYRGHKTRKELKQQQLSEQDKNEKQQAALKIQAGYRGHKTRKEIKAAKAQRVEA